MATPHHILLGTDFSEASQAALEAARDLARSFEAKLTLLHVYPPRVEVPGPGGLEARMEIGREVHESLRTLKDRVAGVPDLHAEIIADASAASVLCDYAGSHGVDLIVVGSHGSGAARRFLLGSVADRVVRHAPCSVLVARK